MTDDAGVLAGLEKNTDLFRYLNMYNYRTWLSDHRYLKHDMYISQDDSVIVSMYNDNLDSIFILKPGYKTNKGIEVGMSSHDMINVYGKFGRNHDYAESYGYMLGYGNDKYVGYYAVEYQSQSNEGLSFIVDRKTQVIKLIRYQKDRHGNSTVFADLYKYHFLPYYNPGY